MPTSIAEDTYTCGRPSFPWVTMAKIKKSLQKQFLADKLVFIDDTEPGSQFFQLREVNDVLHSGRQGFLIAGSPFLVNETEVLVEIIDANGDPIFVSAVRNYAEGQARFVSIEVYEDTPVGPAAMTILGELAIQPNGEPIPEQFRGTFNVKFQRQFIVDPLRLNDSKIRVFKTPELLVSEILAPFRKAVTSSFETRFGTGSAQGNTLIHTINPSDPTPNIYTIATPSTPISKSMEGGGFTASFTASDVDGFFSGVFTSSIASVISDNIFQVSPGLMNPAGSSFVPFGTSNFTISFQDDTVFSTTTLTRSFADVQLIKLKTFSGDIARTKLFVKSIDSEGSFEIIGDQLLESLEVTTTASANLGPATKMGNFFAQEIVDEFWVGGTITQSINPPYIPDAGAIVVSRNTDTLIDSMHISNAPELRGGSGSTGSPTKFIGLTGSVALPFVAGLEYEFGMDATCLKSNDAFVGKLEVFLTGSSFPSSNPLGQKLTEVIIPSGVQRSIQRDLITNFVPVADGTGKLQFVITAGEWYLADVFIKSSLETGFNPDCAEFLLPVFGKRFEQLQFKAQLFDPNNNVFPEEILSDIVFFNGGNLLLRGTDHRIEGKLTVSPSGSGVTLSSVGFLNEAGNPVSGSAIYMGEGRVFHKDTAILLAEDVDGDPIISMGDKLKGFIDPTTGEFVLQIIGTILVGSGSSFVDIRSLLPRKPTDEFFHRIRGLNLDFYDVLGKKAITAGQVQSDTEANFVNAEQIVRMGKYTRGTIPRTVPASSPLIISGITGSLNPFSATTVTVEISGSGTIDIDPATIIWNNTLYGNMRVDIDEVLLIAGEGAYEVDFELKVDTSWVGFASGSNPGTPSEELNLGGTRTVQTITIDEDFFIATTGSFSPDPFISYPIHIPEERPAGFNTLYVLVSLILTTTQD
ncbi:hypothetical protein LCGC14_0969200 [marine sediment metagenome]|uniref:Uncharacterized protein n=1 Tax=marine sediment metagenome TaxID=412755 RepID=A0A0F9NYA4_9ZZZZ